MSMSQHHAGARFSVIIVNYNGREILDKAVASALQEGVLPNELVVVDNGSVDGSDLAIRQAFPGIRLVQNGCNAGFARAVNQGLRMAGAEFALLLNNDAQLGSGALAAFAEAFDTIPKLAIAGGQLRYPDGRLQSAFGPLPTITQEVLPLNVLRLWNPNRYLRSTKNPSTRVVESAYGACLAVRRSALADFGLLDEDFFFYFEEIDWCRRARGSGWQVAFVPGAQATHALGRTAERTFAAARVEYQRAKLTYFRKSGSRARYFGSALAMVFRTGINACAHGLAAALSLFRNPGSRRKARAYWTVLAWQIFGRPASWGLPGKCNPATTRLPPQSRF